MERALWWAWRLLSNKAQAYCVALALKQLNQRGRRVGGKLDLVHPRLRRDVGGVVHRAGGVDHNLATQVGLFLVGLDIEAVGPGVQASNRRAACSPRGCTAGARQTLH